MLAITKKHTQPCMELAVDYLQKQGYQKIRNSWMRGERHAAVLVASPTGRVIVKEGVAA